MFRIKFNELPIIGFHILRVMIFRCPFQAESMCFGLCRQDIFLDVLETPNKSFLNKLLWPASYDRIREVNVLFYSL